MIAKRVLDLCLALPGIVLLSPVMLIIAVLVKAGSPGPVIFRQERVGQHGATFNIFKFRTMVEDAGGKGPSITVGPDPRITKVGSVLRKFKLDELPQLFNVVRGEMSLVGPRPEVPEYVAVYPEATRKLVLSVPPGLTDFAAIEFRDESDILSRAPDPKACYVNEILPKKLELYEKYVRERTLILDLKLIVWTMFAIFRR